MEQTITAEQAAKMLSGYAALNATFGQNWDGFEEIVTALIQRTFNEGKKEGAKARPSMTEKS